jgi:hypothetical protein
VPFDAGRRMAAGIPGARLVPLHSRNHLILEHEPAYGPVPRRDPLVPERIEWRSAYAG